MLKKLAVTSAAVAAVAGLGLAAPAHADGGGPGRDTTQILPIQLCLADLVHVLSAGHRQGPGADECVNGPADHRLEHEFANLNVDKRFFFKHDGYGGFHRGGFGYGKGGFGGYGGGGKGGFGGYGGYGDGGFGGGYGGYGHGGH